MLAIVLLVTYVFFLYVPDLVFRFGTSSVFPLRSARAHTQIQEFFGAGVPSVFFHVLPLLLFNVLVPLFRGRLFLPDWAEIAPLLAKDPNFTGLEIRDFLGPLFYLSVVYLNAYRSGIAYGLNSVLVAEAGGLKEHFGETAGFHYFAYRFWYHFYSDSHEPLFPSLLRKNIVYAHTKEAIFHGNLENADRARDGGYESIYLTDVTKYTREDPDKVLNRGENPITKLSGTIYIKWEAIEEINFPHEADDTLKKQWEFFEKRKRKWPEQFDLPETPPYDVH